MPTPAFIPTQDQRDLVESLAGLGVPQEGIAKLLKVSADTISRHFPEELQVGVLKANAAVAGNLFRMATGEGKSAAVAAFFWLKTRARWKETPVEVDIVDNRDAAKSAEERVRAMALMMAKRSNDDGLASRPESDDRRDVG